MALHLLLPHKIIFTEKSNALSHRMNQRNILQPDACNKMANPILKVGNCRSFLLPIATHWQRHNPTVHTLFHPFILMHICELELLVYSFWPNSRRSFVSVLPSIFPDSRHFYCAVHLNRPSLMTGANSHEKASEGGPWMLRRTGVLYSAVFLLCCLSLHTRALCLGLYFFAAEAPLSRIPGPSRSAGVSLMPCASCRERANEVSGQLMALSCPPVSRDGTKRVLPRVLSVLCVCLSAQPGTVGDKRKHVRWQYESRWMGRCICPPLPTGVHFRPKKRILKLWHALYSWHTQFIGCFYKPLWWMGIILPSSVFPFVPFCSYFPNVASQRKSIYVTF